MRSNVLVSWEVLKLISVEQKLIPEWSSWGEARQSYTAAFNSFKSRLVSGEFGTSKFLREITWGQVGMALRVSVEMAAFYYIGEVIGMILTIPFK